jgi:hypothetical protein
MAWWQWPFFSAGVVTAFAFALVLAIAALSSGAWGGGTRQWLGDHQNASELN